jgi:hypothetical protein
VHSALQQLLLQALPQWEQESVPRELARVLQVSPLSEREQERLQEPGPLQERRPRASAQASMPLPLPNVLLHRRQLPHPQYPSDDGGPFPPLPRLRNWNAFSFLLRQNPAAGQ